MKEKSVLDRAIIFAAEAHAGQKRKGFNTPYIIHPVSVMGLAETMTADEEILAAAVLHDVVEDTEMTADDIRREFGDRVADLVAVDTENKRDDMPKSASWKIRKQETIDIAKNAPREAKLIILCDKLSNLFAIVRSLYMKGEEAWDVFNMKDPYQHIWYYESFIEPFREFEDSPLFVEYVDLMEEMKKLVAEGNYGKKN